MQNCFSRLVQAEQCSQQMFTLSGVRSHLHFPLTAARLTSSSCWHRPPRLQRLLLITNHHHKWNISQQNHWILYLPFVKGWARRNWSSTNRQIEWQTKWWNWPPPCYAKWWSLDSWKAYLSQLKSLLIPIHTCCFFVCERKTWWIWRCFSSRILFSAVARVSIIYLLNLGQHDALLFKPAHTSSMASSSLLLEKSWEMSCLQR